MLTTVKLAGNNIKFKNSYFISLCGHDICVLFFYTTVEGNISRFDNYLVGYSSDMQRNTPKSICKISIRPTAFQF
jgi:hypothetical protein